MPLQPRRVLVVEDDQPIRAALDVALRGEGYAVLALPDGDRLTAKVDDYRPDLALLDVRLGDARTATSLRPAGLRRGARCPSCS